MRQLVSDARMLFLICSTAQLENKRVSCAALKQKRKKSVLPLYLYWLIFELINDLIGK